MAMDQKRLDRINELAHKAKAEGLTPEETTERQELRDAYLKDFRSSFRSQVEMLIKKVRKSHLKK